MQTNRIFAPLFFCLSVFCYSQNGNLPNRPTIEVENLVDAPEVDGNVLEDPIWNEIAPITTLTQVTPKYEQR